MNKNRRQKIEELIKKILSLIDDLERIKEEEDDSRENMPENLENSDNYQKSEECSDAMEETIDDVRGSLNNLLDTI